MRGECTIDNKRKETKGGSRTYLTRVGPHREAPLAPPQSGTA